MSNTWSGTDIYGGLGAQLGTTKIGRDGIQLIFDIVSKFNIEVTIKHVVESSNTGVSPYSIGWLGYVLNFNGLEYKIGYAFTEYDKETVMMKLAAMYPEKVLNAEEMKKHMYKQVLDGSND